MREDKDLEEILSRIAMRYYKDVHEGKRECCKSKYPIGYEVLNYNEFVNILNDCRIVFINYYSPYCPYCEMFYPIYVAIGKKYSGRAAFLRVNVYSSPELVYAYNVLSTPTTLCFVDKKLVYSIPGYVPYDTFEKIVSNIINRSKC
ncbi:MAG: hypothetical protein DRO40_02535 [Thermoprotei archaeon]|nr:MAG: hypothetical protein DRO40_02535 [Thermoprotei archaeon]